MLATFGFVLLVTAAVSPTSFSRQHPFGYELLETRIDQLELKLQSRLEEQGSLLNKANKLLEKFVDGGNDEDQHSSQAPDRQEKPRKHIIKSCREASTSGRYLLRLPNRSSPVAVLCDVDVLDGGWLVIQQRLDGSVSFNRSWAEYRDGFGKVGQASEFWLGLETIHQLTKGGDQELLVQLKNEAGEYGYARYGQFQVGSEEQGYKLSSLNEYNGTIGNKLYYGRNEEFSTFDRDREQWHTQHCAQKYAGGWWFYYCGYTFLNGPFIKNNSTERGIYWSGWTEAATFSQISIRRK